MLRKIKTQQVVLELEDILQSNFSQVERKTIAQLLITKVKEQHKLWLNGLARKLKISSTSNM